MAGGWSHTATVEMLALLLVKFCEVEFRNEAYIRKSLGTLGRLAETPGAGSSPVTQPSESQWQALADTFVRFHGLERPDEALASSEKDLAVWNALTKAILDKQWHREFDSFADIGERCRIRRRVVGTEDPKRSTYPSRLLWMLQPIREFIVGYASEPGVLLEEFVDMASLIPPAGYRVSRQISTTSAFKIVYRGVDPQSRPVAIKRYKDWAGDRMENLVKNLGLTKAGVVARDTLADWLGQVRHTHILPCTTAVNSEGELFIIEPLLEATLESSQIERPEELARLMRQTCQAVLFLHNEGWVHSDIKPDNIGLDRGLAVLLDFGIATVNSPDPRFRSNPGSLKTRAPELFNESAVPTRASDVWAIGATLMALASQGEYPLVTRSELRSLPPAGDPARAYVHETIRSRIAEYQQRPELLEMRVWREIREWFRAIGEVAVSACRLSPRDRPDTRALIEMLDRIEKSTREQA